MILTKENFNELASGMSLCSNASVDNGIYGDPTEIALVEFANYFDLRKDKLEKIVHAWMNYLLIASVRWCRLSIILTVKRPY